jgi:hypothetical protein
VTENGTSARLRNEPEGNGVSKDKKKKDKKAGKSGKGGKSAKKSGETLKALAQNPIVADVVAAALVGMASALKDSDKARRLANKAGDHLDALAKTKAKKGNAMWDLALDIGRRTLDTLSDELKADGKPGKR